MALGGAAPARQHALCVRRRGCASWRSRGFLGRADLNKPSPSPRRRQAGQRTLRSWTDPRFNRAHPLLPAFRRARHVTLVGSTTENPARLQRRAARRTVADNPGLRPALSSSPPRGVAVCPLPVTDEARGRWSPADATGRFLLPTETLYGPTRSPLVQRARQVLQRRSRSTTRTREGLTISFPPSPGAARLRPAGDAYYLARMLGRASSRSTAAPVDPAAIEDVASPTQALVQCLAAKDATISRHPEGALAMSRPRSTYSRAQLERRLQAHKARGRAARDGRRCPREHPQRPDQAD